uniref:Uncharacterized protein n=1 Tax=Ditylenchus dipsaci TaxID=166011 RepID=A0A915ELI9_9BILA
MDKWLVGKTKMLKEACGLSADMNMLNNMVILLQMLENEYKDEEAKWINLNDTAGEVVRLSDNDAFCQQVVSNYR